MDIEKRNKEIEKSICDHIYRESIAATIIHQEQEIIKQEVSTALFKLYCPLVAAGVDKELLKKEIREIYKLYEIDKAL